jgi:hypothetical protein
LILECKDLERALRTPELMPDMRAHAERCVDCRQQLHLWGEISRVAPQLHEEWDSPFLWQRIRANLAAEAPRPRPFYWRWILAGVLVVAVAAVLLQPKRPASRDLLTEHALTDVQQAEAVYVRSIEKLSAVAAKNLDQSSSPVAAAYREKLQVLDSAIAEIRTNVESNQYNTYLRTELASLYRQKQATLQEWLQNANSDRKF